MDPSDDSPGVVPCPQCGGQVQATASDRPQVLDCPHCNQPFVLPPAGGQLAVAQVPGQESFVTDDTPALDGAADNDLDGARIRRVAMLKRAAYRSRSYCVIIAIGCLAGAGQCIWNTVTAIRYPAAGTLTAYGVIALWMAATVGCIYLGNRFYRRAGKYTREAEATSLGDPAAPPDFTPLSDGTHRWKNLENVDEEDRNP